jgi:uncharacterized protein YdiU (UPF0061 family)
MTLRDGDLALALDLLERMATNTADFTLTFRRLCDAARDSGADAAVRALFVDPSAYDAWAEAWRRRLAEEDGNPSERAAVMRAANPAYSPRNHQVEKALAAAQVGDMSVLDRLMAVLATPYEAQPEADDYALPPKSDEVVRQTFCGT